MATLHLVNKESALAACLESAADGDSIVLLEDGVYAAVKNHSRPLLAIDVDVQARGVESRLDSATTVIGYPEFVELAVAHHPIVSWC